MSNLIHRPARKPQRRAAPRRYHSPRGGCAGACGRRLRAKTRTLVTRYLSLVAKDNPLRAVVAITFTDEAALEMRSRLRSAISDYLQEPQLEHRYTHPMGGDCTVSSTVCARWHHPHALHRNPAPPSRQRARLDPRFAVLDATQALLLSTNALDDALAAAVVDKQCAPLFATKKFDDVRKIVNAMLENRLAVAAVSALGDGADITTAPKLRRGWSRSAPSFRATQWRTG